ncbi:hypothetical protein QR98_0045570 [Sarcoptes scabiei]|nr:hypothetical protein QR98_0045570 [Sarcoptes scabiei]
MQALAGACFLYALHRTEPYYRKKFYQFRRNTNENDDAIVIADDENLVLNCSDPNRIDRQQHIDRNHSELSSIDLNDDDDDDDDDDDVTGLCRIHHHHLKLPIFIEEI